MTTQAMVYNPNPSDAQLKEVALNFIKWCKPKDYEQAILDGAVDEWTELKARAARCYAEDLICQGMMPEEAWHMAVQSEILERESD